jgi:hypothetical protein
VVPVEVDFAASTIRYAEEEFPFPALGSVPQSLVAAGGIENLIRQQLAEHALEARV